MANDKNSKEDALITAIHYGILNFISSAAASGTLPSIVSLALARTGSLFLSVSVSLHILTYTNVGENFQLGSLFLTQSMKCKTFIWF